MDFGLTDQETKILELSSKSLSEEEISASLGITVPEVSNAWSSIYRKFGTYTHASSTRLWRDLENDDRSKHGG